MQISAAIIEKCMLLYDSFHNMSINKAMSNMVIKVIEWYGTGILYYDGNHSSAIFEMYSHLKLCLASVIILVIFQSKTVPIKQASPAKLLQCFDKT